MEMVSRNGVYKWGFDLTSFNDDMPQPNAGDVDSTHAGDSDEVPTGVAKFQSLLDLFDLEYMPDLGLGGPFEGFRKFVWQTKTEDLTLVTFNNPITGQYGAGLDRHGEKGYLSYVGVECKSADLLERFLGEFRNRATSIKGEANERVFA